jgi:hypothetical protein
MTMFLDKPIAQPDEGVIDDQSPEDVGANGRKDCRRSWKSRNVLSWAKEIDGPPTLGRESPFFLSLEDR